ncbi:hypothetical protein [uncultured Acetatifactor sp.]|uniref:hypothetical protein n=2 Tax=uncultured Acetatifactor sp. TaxID=1671927 RepID=UPI002601AF39|nr:hypothetical protein [uncultured Acetatifactor sp.]
MILPAKYGKGGLHMGNLLCGAGTLLFRLRCVGGILLAADAGANEWDFLQQDPGDAGVFSTLISKVEDIGASGYQLLLTVGVIGLVFSIIFTALSLLLTSNAQKKEEKKSHALIICIAGIVIFSAFSIIGFFKSIGSGL